MKKVSDFCRTTLCLQTSCCYLPVYYFCLVEQLPWEFRRLLKWRMCAITPNVVKNCIARSGFRPTKSKYSYCHFAFDQFLKTFWFLYLLEHYDWLGCWGRHMKAPGFKSIRDYQKLNHFPGSFQIGRKDRLWRNLSKLQVSLTFVSLNMYSPGPARSGY